MSIGCLEIVVAVEEGGRCAFNDYRCREHLAPQAEDGHALARVGRKNRLPSD
jgi:hypothetical protein